LHAATKGEALATPNSIAVEILQDMEKAIDNAGAVTRTETRVNNALDEIAIATNWNTFRTRGTFSTVIAQAQYQLPVGGREIIQLRYLDTGEPIPLVTIQEAARRTIKLEDAGRARAWLEDGNLVSGVNVLYQYRLAPVPDSILTVEREWFYHPSEVASATVLPVQDQHIVLVKDHVKARLLEIDQKYDAADRCQRRFDANLAKLVKQELSKVAKMNVLKQSDLSNIRRRERPIFDPSHFNNGWS
jgi:hypothetical protein